MRIIENTSFACECCSREIKPIKKTLIETIAVIVCIKVLRHKAR